MRPRAHLSPQRAERGISREATGVDPTASRFSCDRGMVPTPLELLPALAKHARVAGRHQRARTGDHTSDPWRATIRIACSSGLFRVVTVINAVSHHHVRHHHGAKPCIFSFYIFNAFAASGRRTSDLKFSGPGGSAKIGSGDFALIIDLVEDPATYSRFAINPNSRLKVHDFRRIVARNQVAKAKLIAHSRRKKPAEPGARPGLCARSAVCFLWNDQLT